MNEIVTLCPLCGSTAARQFDWREFRNHPVNNLICRSCGFVYQSPRLTQPELQSFYEQEYRLLYQGQAEPSARDLAVQRARAESSLAFIQPWVRQAHTILDIGCSSGALLQRLQDHFKAHGYGVEPGTLYRQYAQSLNLEVYPSLESLPPATASSFDLVSLMHVLEHLPDPVGYLRELREKWLKSDGWLLLEVPNLYAHDCFEVAHLASFSRHTLSQVVHAAGYHITELHLHGLPRSKLIPLYITALAQPDANQSYRFHPEHLVFLKRQLGLTKRHIYTRLFPHRAWLQIQVGRQERPVTHA